MPENDHGPVRWPLLIGGAAITMTLLTWGFASTVHSGAVSRAEQALADAGMDSVVVSGGSYRTLELSGPEVLADEALAVVGDLGIVRAATFQGEDVASPGGGGTVTSIEDMPLLGGIQFAANSSALTEGGEVTLDRAAAVIKDALKSRPTLHIRVEAHTDDVGAEEANLALSQERAEAVVAYLVSRGVPQSVLSAVGYGESQPLADNSTAEGRETNRRIEFYITEGETTNG